MKKISVDKIFQRGIDLMKEKKFEEAKNEFECINQRDNEKYYLQAQLCLIDIYIRSGQWIEVIKTSEGILENHCSGMLKKETVKIQLRLGYSYLLIKRWKDAVKIFNLIDERDCESYDEVRIGLAGAHIELNQEKEAVELFLRVLDGTQHRFDIARNRLGTLCLQKGLGMQAIKALESVSNKDYMLYYDSKIKLGHLYLRANQKDKAAQILRELQEVAANNGNVSLKLLVAKLCKCSGLYKEAIECFDVILNISKGKPYFCTAVQYCLVDILPKREVWKDESLKRQANGFIEHMMNIMPQLNKDEAFLQHENQLAIGKIHLIKNNFTEARNLFEKQENASYHDSKCFLELVRLLEEVGAKKMERIKWNSIEFLEIIDEIEAKLLCAQNMNSVDYDVLDASLEKFKEADFEDIKLEIDDFEFAEYHGYEYKFAHYSRCETVFKLIGSSQMGSPSAFRLGSIGNVNDPKEGVVLGQYLGKCCKLASDIFIDNEPYATFVGCFTFNHDSLNQFRLYGKENNQEASGVSLVFLSDFFGQDNRSMHINNPMRVNDQDHKLKDEDDETNEILKIQEFSMNGRGEEANTDKPIKYNLYRCIYIDPETGYLSLARRDKATFYQECANSMNSEDLDSIRKMAETRWENYSKIIERKENGIRDLMRRLTCLIDEIYEDGANAKEFVDRFMRIGLLKLQYLVKHAAYQEEQECRMIYVTGWKDEKIQSDYKLKTIYVECDGSVVEHLDGIYLSPGAKDAKDHFRVLLRDTEIKIRESRNPFRHR